MYSLDIHQQYMLNAIELAEKGRGSVSPNPLVGCVIVKDGRVIAEGYHKKFGSSHAEIDALNNCSEDPSGADLYVTLEPCSYFGKTPPCVDAIISSSIKNVFIGIKDPNEKINGNGIGKLKLAGIQVFEDILKKECHELNISFLHWIKTKKPWVIAKVAQSNDGFMGTTSKESVWITGEDSRKNVHKLRSKVDGILIGRKTAQMDNPSLTVRKVLGSNPTRIIADTFRKLSLNLNIFNDKESKNIVLCSDKTFDDSETSFCEYLAVKQKGNILDPIHILEVLGEHGFTSIMVEGGKELLSSFIKEDLIDEIHLYTSNNNLKDGQLLNPVFIDKEFWNIIDTIEFENDNLLIARKKELCLQEL